MRITGEYITVSNAGEKCKAFIPQPLPPDPPLKSDSELQELHGKALLSIGRLDGISTLLPDPSIFIYMYVRKEAVLSSQIEGTQSSLSDLLLFENDTMPGVPLADVKEVSNYVAAMNHCLQRLRDGFPLSLRLIKETHKILLNSRRGDSKNPGEFKKSLNWIGGTQPGNAIFVPTPPEMVISEMGKLEKFFHYQSPETPVLIKAALSHAQFETIHPFLDGNGRIGRLLITIILCEAKLLKEPLLYLSLYFKSNRESYYELLQRVRTNGDWESWVKFFLQGIIITAEQAVETARSLVELANQDRKIIQELHGHSRGSALQLHIALQQKPISSIKTLSKESSLTIPTVKSALGILQEAGIANEITGKKRNRIYVYDKYIRLLSEGPIVNSTDNSH